MEAICEIQETVCDLFRGRKLVNPSVLSFHEAHIITQITTSACTAPAEAVNLRIVHLGSPGHGRRSRNDAPGPLYPGDSTEG